ncbi:hypothetical protein ACQY0O_000815 [Thecaphora frezii]
MPDFISIKSILNKLKAEPNPAASRFGPGIGNIGATPVIVQGDDRTFRINLGLRAAQSFFALIMMFIAIYMAVFQEKWIGRLSGLTGLLLFVSVSSLVVSVIFLAVPFVYERSNYKTFKAFYRALQEARVGIVTNAAFAILTLLVAVTQTISAYTSTGCRDATKDPHAKVGDKEHREAFIKELPNWCRTKRAEAAFCWFLWIGWLFTLLIFLRQWRTERKQGPRIPPFTHPTDDSAFEPINDLDEEEDDDGGYARYDKPPALQHLGSYDRRGGNPLADIEAKYGMNSVQRQEQQLQQQQAYGGTPTAYAAAGEYAPNPFADSQPEYTARPSYDYNAYADRQPGAYGVTDPYSAIQQQLNSNSYSHPPPPPNLGYANYR